jgi:ribose transport system substrate-binding protein
MLATQWMVKCASLAVLALGLVGCARSDASAQRKRIAVIPKGTTHEFWKSIHAGAEVAARELGVEVIWKGPQKEDDRDEQIKVVEDFVTRGVDGIVIAPLDDKALATPLRDAHEQGIPVIVIDSDVDWSDRVSFIATDNYAGGVMAAEELGRLMNSEGEALMMRYVAGSASTSEREAGFLDTLRTRFEGVTLVSENQRSGATVEGAYQTAENLLNAFPDVDGIFCPNESSLFGMLRALQDAGKSGKVRLVGFDASEKLIEGLRAGEVDALVIQNPWAMGDQGVRRMLDHIEGRAVDARIDTGVLLVTRATMDDPHIRDVMAPDLSILGD